MLQKVDVNFTFFQHENLLRKKVVISATNHLYLQRNIVVGQVARKMLPQIMKCSRVHTHILGKFESIHCSDTLEVWIIFSRSVSVGFTYTNKSFRFLCGIVLPSSLNSLHIIFPNSYLCMLHQESITPRVRIWYQVCPHQRQKSVYF